MHHTQATRGRSGSGKSAARSHSTTAKAAGKAKAFNKSPPASESEHSDFPRAGSSQKRKRVSKKSSSLAGLDFDQFPPALQKQLLKQALKQAKDKSAEDEAGMNILLIHTKFLFDFV
jgi:hypothetical protein